MPKYLVDPVTTHIHMERSDLREARIRAAEAEVSLSEWIRRAIRKALARAGEKPREA